MTNDLRGILAEGETIFARVAPEHKLRIVAQLKQMGEIVAVTGDGVNDAPALKKADIGIAMGLRGNDVAKEASRMILTDDNFSSIVAAIEEGRAIFDNIKRFAAYVLNSNPQEMYPYIFWVLFPDIPLAMTVMGVLAVDVGTDLIPAMGLGIEPPEEGIMERPPRRRDDKILSLPFILRAYFVHGSLLALSCYATYYYMGWVLGAWQVGTKLRCHAGVAARFAIRPSDAGVPANLDRLLFPHRDHADRQRAVQTLSESLAVRGELSSNLAIAGRPWKRSPIGGRARRRQLLRDLCAPATAWLARFLERHYIVFNLVSNPLIDLGILFELLLCYFFFYTPLADIYYFAPVPWHVYLFACHGTVILLVFEEVKKYYRRKGHPLEFLG